MLKNQHKRKITEDKARRRKEQTPSRLSENMSGHPRPHSRPGRVPFPSGRPLDTLPKYMTQNRSSQEETAAESSVNNSNNENIGQNYAFEINSTASSRYEPLIPDFSLSSSGSGRESATGIPKDPDSPVLREVYGLSAGYTVCESIRSLDLQTIRP